MDPAEMFSDTVMLVMRNALAPVSERLAEDEARLSAAEQRDQQLMDIVGSLQSLFAAHSERLAVLETRAPVPGPPGMPGADGLGVKHFDVSYDGERTFTLRWAADDRTEERSFRVPVLLYRGTWTEGRTYDAGDVVTHQRSAWTCRTTTGTRPGEAAEAWTLTVMRGRDGKDGKP